MANDYSLFVTDLGQLITQFDASSLANYRDADWPGTSDRSRTQLGIEFLQCLWKSEFSLPLKTISRFHTAAYSSKIWSALAEVYSEVRCYLPALDQSQFDTIYLPFIAPSMNELSDQSHPFDLPHRLREGLANAGLCLALSPERCKIIGKSCRTHTFSRLVQLAQSSRGLPPPIPGVGSFFHSMTAASMHTDPLHDSLTAATEGWRILAAEAARRNWGIVAVADV